MGKTIPCEKVVANVEWSLQDPSWLLCIPVGGGPKLSLSEGFQDNDKGLQVGLESSMRGSTKVPLVKEIGVPFLQETWDLIFPLILNSSRLSKPVVPADVLASLQNQSTSLIQGYGIKDLR